MGNLCVSENKPEETVQYPPGKILRMEQNKIENDIEKS